MKRGEAAATCMCAVGTAVLQGLGKGNGSFKLGVPGLCVHVGRVRVGDVSRAVCCQANRTTAAVDKVIQWSGAMLCCVALCRAVRQTRRCRSTQDSVARTAGLWELGLSILTGRWSGWQVQQVVAELWPQQLEVLPVGSAPAQLGLSQRVGGRGGLLALRPRGEVTLTKRPPSICTHAPSNRQAHTLPQSITLSVSLATAYLLVWAFQQALPTPYLQPTSQDPCPCVSREGKPCGT